MRRLLVHPAHPRALQLAALAVAAAGIVLLLAGSSRAEDNPGIWLFWLLWWPAAVLSFPLAGRLWCAACPATLFADLASHLPFRRPAPGFLLRRGPLLPAAAMALVHFADLRYGFEENLPASKALLALLVAGATFLALAFRERIFCRALCPAGALGGLLARLAPLRVTADPDACRDGCVAGTREAARRCGDVCPTIDDPREGVDPRLCILCGRCLRECPASFRLAEGATFPSRGPSAADPAVSAAFLLLAGLGIDAAFSRMRDWPIVFWKVTQALGLAQGLLAGLAFHGVLVLLPAAAAAALARCGGPGFRARWARYGDAALPLAAAALAAVALRDLLVGAPLRLEDVLRTAGLPWGGGLRFFRHLDGLPVRLLQGAAVGGGLLLAHAAMRRTPAGDDPAWRRGLSVAETLWLLALGGALLYILSRPAFSS